MRIKPIGNRIIVKNDTNEQKTRSGLIVAKETGHGANVWGTIISLPITENPFIRSMEIGGKVLYKRFKADIGLNEGDDFEVLEVEPQDGSRQGQVLAYEPPEGEIGE